MDLDLMGDETPEEATEPERFPCPQCNKQLTKMKNGELRTHKCTAKVIPIEQAQEIKAEGEAKQTGMFERCMVAYIATRDEIAALKKAYEVSVEEMKAMQDKRANYLKGQLDALGTDSSKVNGVGTAFFEWKDSAKCSGRAEMMEWIREDWEGRNHFLESRVNKTAVKDHLADEDTVGLPPGIDYTKVRDIKVRRA